MNFMKKTAWLSFVFIISACQNFPIPVPLPIPTAAPTNTQGPPPTPTPLPSPTPLPTMEPVVRIDTGDQALFYGDFDLAREQYLAAFNDTTDDAIKAAALWGIGRTELADGRYQEALNSFNNLINSYPDLTYSARAPFLMGLAYEGLEQFQQAADAYQTYSTRVPGVLDGYVQEYRGDALFEAGNYTEAQNAYNAALSAARLDDGMDLQIKIAEVRASFGDFAGALTLYDQIFAASTNDYIKAQMDYYAGNAHIELGQIDGSPDALSATRWRIIRYRIIPISPSSRSWMQAWKWTTLTVVWWIITPSNMMWRWLPSTVISKQILSTMEHRITIVR